MAYAKEYCGILKTGNASVLLNMTHDKRTGIMKALSNLSKFCGMYEDWQRIRRNYALKWSDSSDGGLRLLAAMTSGEVTLTTMIDWLRKARSVLPDKYGTTLLYNSLTGLRPTEATLSIRLLKAETSGYVNEKDGLIEHFRHPELFIRKTKRAYLSVTCPAVLEAAGGSAGTQNSIRMALRQRNMNMHAGYARKIYATYLRQHGIPQESIDLYQGRLATSIFQKHYYRPDHAQEREKIRGLLAGLLNKLS